MSSPTEIRVNNCNDCPFSGWSTGGHKALQRDGGRVRLQHHCNLQPKSGHQYKRGNEGYSCFANCPLKLTGKNVKLNEKTETIPVS